MSASETPNNKKFDIDLFDTGYFILFSFMFLLIPNGMFNKVESEMVLKMWAEGLGRFGFVSFCVILSASSFRNLSSLRNSSFPLPHCSYLDEFIDTATAQTIWD